MRWFIYHVGEYEPFDSGLLLNIRLRTLLRATAPKHKTFKYVRKSQAYSGANEGKTLDLS